jgi:hypothetical protein
VAGGRDVVLHTPDQLADVAGIRDVVLRCAHGLDRLDEACMRSAYWPDGTDDHGPSGVHPAWEYVAIAIDGHRAWRSTLHCVLNHLVELEPDGVTARGQSYCIASLFAADPPVLHTWYGRYLDRYEKRGDEWRIIERVCVSEGGRTDDPLPAMPYPLHEFRQGSFDRPSSGRPIGP